MIGKDEVRRDLQRKKIESRRRELSNLRMISIEFVRRANDTLRSIRVGQPFVDMRISSAERQSHMRELLEVQSALESKGFRVVFTSVYGNSHNPNEPVMRIFI